MVKTIKQFLLRNRKKKWQVDSGKWEVGIILLLALILIFYKLGSLPARMQTDEAAVSTVKLVISGLQYFTWNDLLQHLALSGLGASFLALRLAPALASFLSVAVFYFFATEIFAFREAAYSPLREKTKLRVYPLLATLLFATNRLFLTFARVTHATALQLLLTLLSYLFFFRLLNNKRKPLYALLCGLCLGVEMHTYTSGPLIPLVIGLTMLLVLAVKKDRLKLLPYFLAVITTAALAGAPRIIMYFLPGRAGLDRAVEVSIFQQAGRSLELLIWAFEENLKKIIHSFYLQGELNGKHNFYALPILDPAGWLFFVVGGISSLYLTCINTLKKNFGGLVLFGFLFFALGVPLLANLFTRPSDVPNFLRSYPFIIPISIFVTLGIKYIWERVKIIRPTLVLLTVFTVCFGPFVYFFHQTKYLNIRGWLETVEPELMPYHISLEEMKTRDHIYSEAYNKYLQAVENGADFSRPLCLDNGTIDKDWVIFSGSENPCEETTHAIKIDSNTGDILEVN